MHDPAWPSVFLLYASMGLFVIGAVFFLVRAARRGAFRDIEAPKYRMMQDDVLPAIREGGKHGRQD